MNPSCSSWFSGDPWWGPSPNWGGKLEHVRAEAWRDLVEVASFYNEQRAGLGPVDDGVTEPAAELSRVKALPLQLPGGGGVEHGKDLGVNASHGNHRLVAGRARGRDAEVMAEAPDDQLAGQGLDATEEAPEGSR